MFAKLTDGVFTAAPSTLTLDGKVHYHPSEELYRSLGWLPVVEAPHPEADEESNITYAATWQERDGEIVRVWVEAEPEPELPEPSEPPSVELRVSALEEAMLAIMEGVS